MARKALYKSRWATIPQSQSCHRCESGFFSTVPQLWHTWLSWVVRVGNSTTSAPALAALRRELGEKPSRGPLAHGFPPPALQCAVGQAFGLDPLAQGQHPVGQLPLGALPGRGQAPVGFGEPST